MGHLIFGAAYVIMEILVFFIDLFPDIDPAMSANIVSFTQQGLSSNLTKINYFFPIDTVWNLLASVLIIEAGVFFVRRVLYILQLLSLGFLKTK